MPPEDDITEVPLTQRQLTLIVGSLVTANMSKGVQDNETLKLAYELGDYIKPETLIKKD